MIIVPQTVTSAKASVEVELDHHCSRCGAVSTAMVEGRGRAAEQRFFFEQGSSDAKFLAEVEAQRDAALLIRAARCPRCRRRDPAQLRTLWLPLVWVALGAAALDVIGDGSMRARLPVVVCAALLGWLVVGARAFRVLRCSDHYVRFIDVPALAAGPYR